MGVAETVGVGDGVGVCGGIGVGDGVGVGSDVAVAVGTVDQSGDAVGPGCPGEATGAAVGVLLRATSPDDGIGSVSPSPQAIDVKMAIRRAGINRLLTKPPL